MENWKTVSRYENYEISDLGKVRSIPRISYRKVTGTCPDCGNLVTINQELRTKGKILSSWDNGDYGHQMVGLYPKVGGKKTMKGEMVHRLVLEAFVGPCPEGMECCHNDGNPKNNHLGNLRWDTRKNNTKDSIQHGTFCKGSRSGKAKLKEEDIPLIRQELIESNGVWGSMSAIARKRGVDTATIRDVRDRRTWNHVP